MITQYDKNLAVVDEDWLNRVGTAYAIAYYEHACREILDKMGIARKQTRQIEQLLDDDTDATGSLDEHLGLLHAIYEREMEGRLQSAENRLFAIKNHEWVEAPINDAAVRELGNPRLVTREEFEGSWQKAEAGY